MEAQSALVPDHWMEEARFHTWESWVWLIGTQVLAVRCQAPREGMELGVTGITVGFPKPQMLSIPSSSSRIQIILRSFGGRVEIAHSVLELFLLRKMTLNFLTLLPPQSQVLGLQGLQTRTTTPSYCSLPRKDKACSLPFYR